MAVFRYLLNPDAGCFSALDLKIWVAIFLFSVIFCFPNLLNSHVLHNVPIVDNLPFPPTVEFYTF